MFFLNATSCRVGENADPRGNVQMARPHGNADLWPVLPVGAGTRGPEDRATAYRHLRRSTRTALPDAAGGDAYRRPRPTLRRLTATASDRRRSPPAGVARAAGGTACRLPEAHSHPLQHDFSSSTLAGGKKQPEFPSFSVLGTVFLSPERRNHRCRQSDQTTPIPAPPPLPVVMPDRSPRLLARRKNGPPPQPQPRRRTPSSAPC